MKPRVLVATFAYNEGEKIRRTLARHPPGREYDLLVADDGSTDGSLGDVGPDVIVLRSAKNLGIGAAMKGVFEYALEKGYDILAIQAGNDKDDPLEIPRLLDPILARNAVFARASLTRYALPDRDALDTLELEGRGYVGLVGRSVLVLRAVRDDADGPRPPYLQPLLGGMSNLRGFGAGSAVGDTLVAGSAELRVQVASPLRFGKLGVNGFADLGTVYDKGSSLRDQEMKKGVGAGVWFSAAFLHVSLAVAHGIGGSTHLHFGGTFAF